MMLTIVWLSHYLLKIDDVSISFKNFLLLFFRLNIVHLFA